MPNLSLKSFCFLGLISSRVLGMSFGTDGTPGEAGQRGANGRSGVDGLVLADGRPQQVTTNGQEGGAGGAGRDGGHAWGCSYIMDARNYEGALGGDGGLAGNGGTGGNAGDVSIYFSDVNHLRLISVSEVGGRGGEGGSGSWGGDGCSCQSRLWQVNGVIYRCTDGSRGRPAYEGRRGDDGASGKLFLIQQSTPLPPEAPEKTVDVSRLLAGETRLSQYVWDARSGAAQLLAAGSKTPDHYSYYLGTNRVSWSAEWRAARSVADFANASVSLILSPQGAGWTSTNGAWLEGDLDRRDALHPHLSITKALWQHEAEDMVWDSVTGVSQDFSVQLSDRQHMQDLLTTKFYLKFYRRAPFGNVLIWEGWVSGDQVNQVDGQYGLAIGKLPINANELRQGKRVRLEITATRSSGTHEAQVRWEKDLKI